MNISKITIGRLYNLGNYEHIRYELTVDVKEGESAETAFCAVENILTGLDPKKPNDVRTLAELNAAASKITQVLGMTGTEFAEKYPRNGGRISWLADAQKKHKEAVRRSYPWIEHQSRCRRLFDDLGGASKFTDAKQNWDNDVDVEF